jgi:hypothetical protein
MTEGARLLKARLQTTRGKNFICVNVAILPIYCATRCCMCHVVCQLVVCHRYCAHGHDSFGELQHHTFASYVAMHCYVFDAMLHRGCKIMRATLVDSNY